MSAPVESANMCFACGPDNPVGLKIRFTLEGDVCTARFTPGPEHVGWHDTVHGGILYAALDDVTANVIYLSGRKAHTARAEIRYRQSARVGEALRLRGWIDREKGRLVMLRGEARRERDNAVVAELEASFMVERE
jgi:acyl-coenzyme A thioesterase PaaI-like protein